MTPEYWQKVKRLLDEASEVTRDERTLWLEKACGDDEELRREVESFLAFDSGSDRLETPAFSFTEKTGDEGAANEPGAAFEGREIGRYRTVSELGRGGMGLVFLAERSDGAFDQKVALKLIKRGMDSDAVLERFFNERRILASLVHQNIAHLIDGGTTDDGVPYFVMEYVDGMPILDYALANDLGVEEKLVLFRQVASAVSFAHQNLVIHRDLKPSNILVTSAGIPKLLDFGIAKLLTSANGGMITATQQFVLTPDYASPEQVRGEQLTTATDVYSLGIILYELLTSVRPYKADSHAFAEIIRVVCETEALPPSRVAGSERAALKGDLDNIILKSLRKEPDRRYSSVEQFSADIRRHLERLPVTAGSDSLRYRIGKFVSRHRYAVLTAALIIIALLVGLGTTLYQANIARRERMRAEQRFNDVRQLANSFMFEINEKIAESPIKARELLVARAIEYLDKLAAESDGDPVLQAELATAYEKIGQVQSELFNPSLGKSSDALISHQKSLEIREKLFAAKPDDATRGIDVISSRLHLGDSHSTSGKIKEARGEYQTAVALGEQLVLSPAQGVEKRGPLARSYARLGQNYLRSGSLGAALSNYERSLVIYQALLTEAPADTPRKRSVSIIYNYIGYVRLETLEIDEALVNFRNALAMDEDVLATDPQNRQFRSGAVSSHLWLGVAAADKGLFDESLGHLRRALELQKEISAADPEDLGEQNGLGDCYLELGRAAIKAGDQGRAVESLEQAVRYYSAVWAEDQQNLSTRRQRAFANLHLAEAFYRRGETQRAHVLYSQLLDEYPAIIASDPDNTEWQGDLALCHLKMGQTLLKQNDRTAATQHFTAAVTLFEKLTAASPENARLRRDLQMAKTEGERARGRDAGK